MLCLYQVHGTAGNWEGLGVFLGSRWLLQPDPPTHGFWNWFKTCSVAVSHIVIHSYSKDSYYSRQ